MIGLNTMIEADLHGLVDGQIEANRRAGALRRLAASPAERAQVEAWQAQGDLLRSAFAGVDREPVPAMLSLEGRPQLHCVPANDAPLIVPAVAPKSRFGWLESLGAVAVVTVGLTGSWILLNGVETDGTDAAPPHRGSIDAELARRSAVALETAAPVEGLALAGLPTTKIPDLHTTGFGLVVAETVGGQPQTIVFRYQNKNAERVVLSVARVADTGTTPPAPIGAALSWRSGDKVFALAGTVDRNRLRTIASTLQQASR